MKIAFISDVHANSPALIAVLNDLQDVDTILHAGDIVGYNPFPSRVISYFQDKNIKSVSGNHDQAVVGETSFEFTDPVGEVINWTQNQISSEEKKTLAQIPTELKIQLDNKTIQLVHGSPDNMNKYVYPTDLSLDLVDNLDEDVDIFVWGHTHYPIATKINNKYLLNPGSVGQPRDGDWRASYMVFDTNNDWLEFRRKEFDISTVTNKAKAESFPQSVIDLLRQPD